jgi:hypothetical protein
MYIIYTSSGVRFAGSALELREKLRDLKNSGVVILTITKNY